MLLLTEQRITCAVERVNYDVALHWTVCITCAAGSEDYDFALHLTVYNLCCGEDGLTFFSSLDSGQCVSIVLW
jgi:hypothetical protein